MFETADARIGGFVFLHNPSSDLLDRLRGPARADLHQFPMFGSDQVGELRELLGANPR
jgi:hypothetical protein